MARDSENVPTGEIFESSDEYMRGLTDHQLGTLLNIPPADRREAARAEYDRRKRQAWEANWSPEAHASDYAEDHGGRKDSV
jgi:hypothetical protein